jgi:hypothetical protein
MFSWTVTKLDLKKLLKLSRGQLENIGELKETYLQERKERNSLNVKYLLIEELILKKQ